MTHAHQKTVGVHAERFVVVCKFTQFLQMIFLCPRECEDRPCMYTCKQYFLKTLRILVLCRGFWTAWPVIWFAGNNGLTSFTNNSLAPTCPYCFFLSVCKDISDSRFEDGVVAQVRLDRLSRARCSNNPVALCLSGYRSYGHYHRPRKYYLINSTNF